MTCSASTRWSFRGANHRPEVRQLSAERADPLREHPPDLWHLLRCAELRWAQHPGGVWCTRHAQARCDAMRDRVGEAEWLASAVPFPPKRLPSDCRRPACRFCPDRDAAARDLCRKHEMRLFHARRAPGFDEEACWLRRSLSPGARLPVEDCLRRAESEPSLCHNHRKASLFSGQPEGLEMERSLVRRSAYPVAGIVQLGGLQPLSRPNPLRPIDPHPERRAGPWHPMSLRRLVQARREAG